MNEEVMKQVTLNCKSGTPTNPNWTVEVDGIEQPVNDLVTELKKLAVFKDSLPGMGARILKVVKPGE